MLAAIFAAVTFAVAVLYFALFRGIDPMQPDSESYLVFDLERTIGYPAFLAIFRAAGLGLESVVVAQLALLCAATLLLALETAAFVRSAIAGGVLLVGTFANAELMRFSFLIMTESVAATLCLLLLILLLRFCRSPNVSVLAGMSTVAGLSLLVRPVLLPLFIVPILASMGFKRPLATRVVAIAAPAIACVLVGSFAQYMIHGYFGTQSFIGDQMIGKVGIYASGEIATQETAIIERLRGPAEAVRRLQQEFPGSRYRFLVTVPYYDEQRSNVWPVVQDLAATKGKRPDDVALSAAIDVARAHPAEYLSDIGLNLYALWFLPRLMTRAELDAFETKLAKLELLPLIDESTIPRAYPAAIVFSTRISFMLALAASLTAIVLWLVGWLKRGLLRPGLVAAAACGTGIHGVFLLTALVQAGLPRYAMMMWPMMMCTIALLPSAFIPWLRAA